MSEESRTVFIVDDDPSIRKSMSRALQKRGLDVVAFESAEGFLSHYQADVPGCLVLDLSMPGMSGLELQQALASRSMCIPVIFITGHGGVPESVQALKSGAIDFLEKPFRQEVLLERIDEAFVEDRRRREAKAKTEAVRQRFDRLTEREREVLTLLVSGLANLSSKEIARKLAISPRTVEHHRARIMEKTEARSITELAQLASVAELRG